MLQMLYYIYKDSILNKSDTWTPGNDIFIDIDGLPAGTYEYSIEIHYDDLVWTDVVIIEVLAESGDKIPGFPIGIFIFISVLSLSFLIQKKKRIIKTLD